MVPVLEVSTSSHMNRFVENKDAKKVPGRKNMVTMANVVKDAESLWRVRDSFLPWSDASRLAMLSFCDMKLKSCGSPVSEVATYCRG